MSCGCEVRIINTGGGAGADIFVTGGSIVGDDIVLSRNGAPDITIVGAAAGVDFTALTAQEITDLTQAIDYTQLTAQQITDLSQIIDFTQLTAQQVTDLQAVIQTMDTLELFTVNAGTTAASGDDANGSVIMTMGDLLHFWSSNGTVNVNVTPGSAVVDIQVVNPNVQSDDTIDGDGSAGSPLTIVPSADTGNLLTLGADGQLYVAPGNQPITLSDTTADANHTQDFANFNQTWDNMSAFDVNIMDGAFDLDVTSVVGAVAGLNVGGGSVVMNQALGNPFSLTNNLSMTATENKLESSINGGTASYSIQNGAVSGDAQLFLKTSAVDAGTATVGQVLTLDAVTGEAEWRDATGGAGGAVNATAADVGTAANAGEVIGVDPSTGDMFYVDAAGDWQPLPYEGLAAATTADVGNAAPGNETIGRDPATGDLFYVDAAGNWQAVPGGGDNFVTANLTATADRTHNFGSNTLRINADTGGEIYLNSLDSGAFPPVGGNLSVTNANALLGFVGPGGGSIEVNNSGVDLNFGGSGDLEIVGDAGTSGQYLSSNGAGSPPSWEDLPAEQWETVEFFNTNFNPTTDYTGSKEYISVVNTGAAAQTITGLAGNDVSIDQDERVNLTFFDGSWYAKVEAGGANLFDADDTLTAARSHDLADQGLTFTTTNPGNGAAFNVNLNNYGFSVSDLASTEVASIFGNGKSLSITDNNFNIVTNTAPITLNGDPGTSGQVLTSNGAGAAPTWQTLAGGGGNLGDTNLTQTDVNRTFTIGGNFLFFTGTPGSGFRATANTIELVSTTSGQSLTMNTSGINLNFAAGNHFAIDNDAGNAGEVLTSNGTGNAPTWEPASGGGGLGSVDQLQTDINRSYTIGSGRTLQFTNGTGPNTANFSVNVGNSIDLTSAEGQTVVRAGAAFFAATNLGFSPINGLSINTDGLPFFIDNNSGVSGQQFTSQGAGSSPIWGAASDRRIKKNVKKLTKVSAKLASINGVSFTYKADDHSTYGVIAQDVEKDNPDLVHQQVNGDIEDFRTVDYNGIIALLVEEVKALRTELDDLKAK